MFQMIVAVISIALVAAIALAVLWFGGSSFMNGGDKAKYAQYMNHGSQIEGALKMYQSDTGFYPTGTPDKIVDALVKGDTQNGTYLTAEPQGSWYVEKGTIYRDLSNMDECSRINSVARKDITLVDGGCPVCDNDNYKDWPGCRREPISTTP